MEALTTDRVRELHGTIVNDGHGDCRIISEAGLHELVFRANLVPEPIPRAALVFYTLCAYPLFRDGNEETARALALDILASSGYRLTGDAAGLPDLAAAIHSFTAEQEDIEHWLLENVRKSG